MSGMWRVAGALALTVMLAAPADAQRGHGMRGHGPGHGQGMMRGGPDQMGRNPAAIVLDHAEALELNESQVQRLGAIRDRVEAENGPRWERLRDAFGEADAREMTVEQRRALRERMAELQPVREEIRATNRAAGEQIHELLTDEQLAELRPIMRADRSGQRPGGMHHRGPRGMGPGGGPGAGPGGSGGGIR